MRKLSLHLTGLLLGLTLACGGSNSTPNATAPAPNNNTPTAAATGLSYTNPTGTGWRLVKDDVNSSPSRIVLNLVGPSGLMTRGVGFNMKVPSTVHVGGFGTSNLPINDMGVYELLSMLSTGDPLEPKLLVGGVKPGNLLTVSAFQKDRNATAKDSGSPIFQIALEWDATSGLKQGTALPLAITKAKYLPQDIGSYVLGDVLTQAAYDEMKTKAKLVDAQIAVGSLSAH